MCYLNEISICAKIMKTSFKKDKKPCSVKISHSWTASLISQKMIYSDLINLSFVVQVNFTGPKRWIKLGEVLKVLYTPISPCFTYFNIQKQHEL